MYRRFASKVKVTSETLFLFAKNANDSSMDKIADADYWLLQQNCYREEAKNVERKVRGGTKTLAYAHTNSYKLSFFLKILKRSMEHFLKLFF